MPATCSTCVLPLLPSLLPSILPAIATVPSRVRRLLRYGDLRSDTAGTRRAAGGDAGRGAPALQPSATGKLLLLLEMILISSIGDSDGYAWNNTGGARSQPRAG